MKARRMEFLGLQDLPHLRQALSFLWICTCPSIWSGNPCRERALITPTGWWQKHAGNSILPPGSEPRLLALFCPKHPYHSVSRCACTSGYTPKTRPIPGVASTLMLIGKPKLRDWSDLPKVTQQIHGEVHICTNTPDSQPRDSLSVPRISPAFYPSILS